MPFIELTFRTGAEEALTLGFGQAKNLLIDWRPAFREMARAYQDYQERVFASEGRMGLAQWKPLSPRYCLDPETPVLTRDLRWIPIGKLCEGDELWAPQEHGRVARNGATWRYWEEARVEGTRTLLADCLTLVFESGRSVTCTAGHPWLAWPRQRAWPRRAIPRTNHQTDPENCAFCRGRARRGVAMKCARHGGMSGRRFYHPNGLAWRLAADLRAGDWLPAYSDVWGEDLSYEAGWLAGLADGEGYLSVRPGRGGARGATVRLSISQKEGLVAERARYVMTAMGLRWSESGHDVLQFELNGGSAATARLLGMIRPVRLLPKWRGGVLRAIREERVIAVEPAGVREVVDLQTSSSTYFAAGLASHNSQWKQKHYPGRPIGTRTGALRTAAKTIAFLGPDRLAMGPGNLIPYGKYFNALRPFVKPSPAMIRTFREIARTHIVAARKAMKDSSDGAGGAVKAPA